MKTRGSAPTHDSRVALLKTAMAMFAEVGIGAVSVRAVNRTAGLAAAAVHYHFGSKQALLDAAVDLHATAVLEGISAACDTLCDSRQAPTPREFVDVFANPYRELLRREPVSGAHWLAIVAQLALADDGRLRAQSTPVTQKLERLARRSFPNAPPADVEKVLRIALVTFIQMAVHSAPFGVGDDRLTAELAEFVTGGMSAVLGGPGPPTTSDGDAAA